MILAGAMVVLAQAIAVVREDLVQVLKSVHNSKAQRGILNLVVNARFLSSALRAVSSATVIPL